MTDYNARLPRWTAHLSIKDRNATASIVELTRTDSNVLIPSGVRTPFNTASPQVVMHRMWSGGRRCIPDCVCVGPYPCPCCTGLPRLYYITR